MTQEEIDKIIENYFDGEIMVSLEAALPKHHVWEDEHGKYSAWVFRDKNSMMVLGDEGMRQFNVAMQNEVKRMYETND